MSRAFVIVAGIEFSTSARDRELNGIDMGFKVDASFLRFLTIGAIGAIETKRQLRHSGFEPIDLERYCTSNKIWATKIKRLRLPDLLCVKTGLRVEVKAKSKMTIKMSDSPTNADRAWDAGLRPEDLIAFILCNETNETHCATSDVNFFQVEDLQTSAHRSTLGKPKSADEGSERDRTWPITVASKDGTVSSVRLQSGIPDAIVTTFNTGRKQTYKLNGKSPYLKAGESFQALATVIAGVPDKKVDINTSPFKAMKYDVLSGLQSSNIVDRYAAAKALPFRPDLHDCGVTLLERLIYSETDQRVQLEVAASASILGSKLGEAFIDSVLTGSGPIDLKMEAVFILTEQVTEFALLALLRIAKNQGNESELRQAAVWGLGAVGHKRFDQLVQFMDDDDDDVAMHAISAVSAQTDELTISNLVSKLDRRSPRIASAASEALRLIGNEAVVKIAVDALLSGDPEFRDWLIATIGRLDETKVRAQLNHGPMLSELEPMLLLYSKSNWLEHATLKAAFKYLEGQRMFS